MVFILMRHPGKTGWRSFDKTKVKSVKSKLSGQLFLCITYWPATSRRIRNIFIC
jgi:hypothetical protein